MEYRTDTIAATATALGHAAIAMVRLSGTDALIIADKIFKGKKKLSDINKASFAYGYIYDPLDNQEIDEVLISVFKAPNSFTAEDTVEINCHGGIVIPNKILDLLLKNGARLALKGEFSKRAYLNGKLDLSQAEAINDIIHSSTLAGSSLALSNLKKGLSSKLEQLKNQFTFILAKIEAILDYPEEEIEEVSEAEKNNFKDSLVEIKNILEQGKRSRKIAQGFRVVLVGKTNVGKSSLLNSLSGEEKAIVSQIHGTTRDVIEVELNLKGLPVVLIDTAGVRDEVENEIESYGILKTQQMIEKADLIIFISDSKDKLGEDESEIFSKLDLSKVILGLNKSDLKDGSFKEEQILKSLKVAGCSFSAKENRGIENLINLICEKLEIQDQTQSSFYVNKRQDEILNLFYENCNKAYELLLEDENYDIVAFELRRGLEILGEILGYSLQEDVLETIFANFCVGK